MKSAADVPKLSPLEFYNLANSSEEGLEAAFNYYVTVVLKEMQETRNYDDPEVSAALQRPGAHRV